MIGVVEDVVWWCFVVLEEGWDFVYVDVCFVEEVGLVGVDGC